MSRAERAKGKRGELEVAANQRRPGIEAMRDGRLAADLRHGATGYHLEVKRCEALRLPTWHRQAALEAAPGTEPVVIYRRSHEPWRASISLDALARLIAAAGRS